MIRKLNICLFAALLLLLGMKTIKDRLSAPPAPDVVVEAKPVRNAEFEPTIYYVPWAPYAVISPLTNRNGYLLDVLRTIFPNARLVRVYGSVRDIAARLREDPSGVQCEYGDHMLLTNIVSATTPLMVRDIAVYTARTSPWVYEDLSSLEKICVSVSENDLAGKVICDYVGKHRDDPKRLRIFTGSLRDNKEWQEEMRAKRVDGYVDTRIRSVSSFRLGSAADQMLLFRVSPKIDTVPCYFSVSDRDPAYAKLLIDAYERGYREIEASGELRRLREYYGIEQ